MTLQSFQHEEECYFIRRKQHYSWLMAQADCLQEHATLWTINSHEQWEYLSDELKHINMWTASHAWKSLHSFIGFKGKTVFIIQVTRRKQFESAVIYWYTYIILRFKKNLLK